jgi:hypothetical protein
VNLITVLVAKIANGSPKHIQGKDMECKSSMDKLWFVF